MTYLYNEYIELLLYFLKRKSRATDSRPLNTFQSDAKLRKFLQKKIGSIGGFRIFFVLLSSSKQKTVEQSYKKDSETQGTEEKNFRFLRLPVALIQWAVIHDYTDALYFWSRLKVQYGKSCKKDLIEFSKLTRFSEDKCDAILKWLAQHQWVSLDNYGNIYFRSKRYVVRKEKLIRSADTRYYFDGPFKEFCVSVGCECLVRRFRSRLRGTGKLKSIHKGGISNSLIAKFFNRSINWAVKWKYKAMDAGYLYTYRRYGDVHIDPEDIYFMRTVILEPSLVMRDGEMKQCLSNFISTNVELCKYRVTV